MHDKILTQALDAYDRLANEAQRQVDYIYGQLDSGRREAGDETILSERLRQILKPTGVLA